MRIPISLILTFAWRLAPFASAQPQNRLPNILIILSDDQGWNQVGYHGFDWYETPNIDRISREGMHFTNAYSAAPICSPARATLMTGKAPA